MSLRPYFFTVLNRAWAVLVLSLGLARTPVLRQLVANGISFRNLAPWALHPAPWAGLACFAGTALNAIAGPTQLATTPAQPIEVKVGAAVEIRFSLINTVTDAKSYRVAGKLPPGLSFVDIDDKIINEREGVIKGKPTKPGTYKLSIVGCEDYNGFGRSKKESLVIKVVK